MSALRITGRVLLLLLVLLLVAAAIAGAWALRHRDQVRAWRQASVIAAHVADRNDLPTRLARTLATDTTSIEPVPTTDATLRATRIAPRADGPHPTVVLLQGPDWAPADARRAQRAFAAAGITAYAIELPTDAVLLGDPTSDDRIDATLRSIARAPGTRGREVSVVAAGPAASIVLRLLGSDEAPPVDALVAAQPVPDFELLLRRVLGDRSVAPDLRQRLEQLVVDAAGTRLGANALFVRAFLDAAARDPQAFDRAWSRLPERIRRIVTDQSPAPTARNVDARVLVVVDDSLDRVLGQDVERFADHLHDARVLHVDSTDLDSLDLDRAFELSAWWLLRAGA